MKVPKSFLLQQQYFDSWEYFKNTINDPSFPTWNYIIITCSNEFQSISFTKQIELRKDYFPKKTKIIVLPDEKNKRMGSGGATLSVIRYLKKIEPCLDGLRILLIHSGGDSKRTPQYSVLGKLFSPFPRILPDGRPSTLFDEIIISMSCITTKFKEGMFVLFGGGLLLFNSLKVKFSFDDVCCITFKEKVDIGTNHGVFVGDNDGYVKKCLQKKTKEELEKNGAVDENGFVDMDTSAFIFSNKFLEALFSLIDTDEKYFDIVNKNLKLSLYFDFLFPLAKDSTLEMFLKEKPEYDDINIKDLEEVRQKLWEAINNTKFKIKQNKITHTFFLNLTSSSEILKFMTEDISDFSELGWKKVINSNSQNTSAYNSIICPESESLISPNVYIKDSYIHSNVKINKNVLLSYVEIKEGQTIPENVIMHGLKQKNGKFVCRILGLEDNPKQNKLFNIPISELPFEFKDKDKENVSLWNIDLYPECDTLDDAINQALNIYYIAHKNEKGNLAQWKGYNKKSLCSGFFDADIFWLFDWDKKMNSLIKVGLIEKLIYEKEDVEEVKNIFDPQQKVLDNYQKEWLDLTLKKSSFDKRIRLFYYIGKALNDENYITDSFQEIKKIILEETLGGLKYNDSCKIVKDKHIVNLPLRVNFGGGYSDTPPYCIENGGKVLNTAILLKGKKPVEVTIEKINEKKIVFSSHELDVNGEFKSLSELQKTGDPFDPFALPKACLLACGIIPREGGNLEEILTRMGGGFSMNSEVINVPKGSGLGTSSILAAACVKALSEFVGINYSENELYTIVLSVEQLMSTGGGWQDQVGGVCNGIKIITSKPGVKQDLHVRHLNVSKETIKELNKRFVIIYTGEKRLARNILRSVLGKYIGNVTESVKGLKKIQELADEMSEALEKGKINWFANLLNIHWDYMKMIDSGSTNGLIEKILYYIDDLIDGKFISGAGGGGFLQAVLKVHVTKEMLHKRLKEIFPDSDIDVWDCSISI